MRKKREKMWTMAGGMDIELTEMEDSHIINCIVLLLGRKVNITAGFVGLHDDFLKKVLEDKLDEANREIYDFVQELKDRNDDEVADSTYHSCYE